MITNNWHCLCSPQVRVICHGCDKPSKKNKAKKNIYLSPKIVYGLQGHFILVDILVDDHQKGTTIGEPRNDTHAFQSNSMEPRPSPLMPVNCETRRLSGLSMQIHENNDKTGQM